MMAPNTPPSGSSAAPSPNPQPGPLPGPQNARLGPNQDGNRIIRKRNRIPLSCGPCRQRKLKCNRSHPCENCVKRGDTAQCNYAAASSRRKTGGRGGPLQLNPDDMQDRINRLEALVLNLVTEQNQIQTTAQSNPMSPVAAARSMMTQGSTQDQLTPSTTTDHTDAMEGAQPEPDSETERVTNSLGVMHVHQNKSLYIGNTHWAAVLDDIHEVKNYFIEHKKQYEDQIQQIRENNNQNGANTSIGPSFLLNAGPTPVFSNLLNDLPSKDTADKLVGVYFDQYDRLIHVLHPPSWKRTYETFWANQSVAEPAFVGQIFAMMGIALQALKRAGQEPTEFLNRSEGIATRYRQLTVQCLQLVDYSKPSLYVLEALVLHSRGEYHRSKETNTGVWVLNAIIVRIAMRMGLHRDPNHYNIPPFVGEMRRRLWTWICMSDTLYSQQGGLPSMIRPQDCDTQLPTNLYDEEIDETTAILPASRPASQFTPITYMIAKAALTKTLSQIVDLHSTLQATSHEDVMRLDAELSNTYQTMPSVLRVTDETTPGDPPSSLHGRYSIAMLYHKSMCVLHREFLAKAREEGRYRESRRRCIDSAIKLLQYQATMHFEARPGGRFPGLAWYDASISSNDFLLAATIVSLDLWYSAQAVSLDRPSDDVATWGHDRMPEMKDALMTSRNIWGEQRGSSMEAYKAFEVIGVMLGKVDSLGLATASGQASEANQGYPYPQGAKGDSYSQGQEEEKPEQQAAMTLGMLSTGMGQTPGNQQSPTGYSAAYPTPSSGQPTPGALAAAARAVQDLNNNNNTFDQTAAQYANFFQTGVPQNIDWGELDNLMMPDNHDPAPAVPDLLGGLNVNWQPDPALGVVDGTDINLPQQAGDLNTNLFANGTFMGTGQSM